MRIGTAIFTQNCDNWRLQRCLECHLKQTRLPDEIMVIDFGSSKSYKAMYKKTIKKLNKNSIVRFVEVEKGKGLFHPSRMCNYAIKETTSDYLVYTGVDEMPGENAYESIEKQFTKRPTALLMCARMDLGENSQNPDANFSEEMDKWWKTGGGVPAHRAPGSLMCLPVDWLKKVGGFDEYYIGWGFYDIDIQYRIQRAGLPQIWLNDSDKVKLLHVWHRVRIYKHNTDINKSQQRFRSFKGVRLAEEDISDLLKNGNSNNRSRRLHRQSPDGSFKGL